MCWASGLAGLIWALTTLVNRFIADCNAANSECTEDLVYDDSEGADNSEHWAAIEKCAKEGAECFGGCTTS